MSLIALSYISMKVSHSEKCVIIMLHPNSSWFTESYLFLGIIHCVISFAIGSDEIPGSHQAETHLKFMRMFLGFCKNVNMSIGKYCFPWPFCPNRPTVSPSVLQLFQDYFSILIPQLSQFAFLCPNGLVYSFLFKSLFIPYRSFLSRFCHSLSVRVSLWKRQEPGHFSCVKTHTALSEGDIYLSNIILNIKAVRSTSEKIWVRERVRLLDYW